MAEWSGSDSDNLSYCRQYLDAIYANQEWANENMVTDTQLDYFRLYFGYAPVSNLVKRNSSISIDMGKILELLGTIQTQNSQFGYAAEDTLKNDLNVKHTSLEAKLDEIIAALEALKDSEGGSGDDGTGTTINETWLTEDTFKTDFGGFVDIYNGFIDSWGFTGGSSGDTLKKWISGPVKGFSIFSSNVRPNPEPFPGNGYLWYDQYGIIDNTKSYNPSNLFDGLSYLLMTQSLEDYKSNQSIAMKQAWNDWQAHTNLISRLDHIFQLEDKSELSFNSETGQVTLKDTGGSGGEVTDVLPVSTNTVDTAVQAVTNTTERIAGIFNRDEVEKRYLNDELLSVGQNYGGIGDEFGAVAAGVLVTPWFTIDFNVWGQSYRNALPISRLNSWRTVAGYIWTLASIVLCVILVRRWGNM